MQYISVKVDLIEVNPYTIQLLHRVQCIRLNDKIQTAAFMTVLALHLRELSKGRYYIDRGYQPVKYGSYHICRGFRCM